MTAKQGDAGTPGQRRQPRDRARGREGGTEAASGTATQPGLRRGVGVRGRGGRAPALRPRTAHGQEALRTEASRRPTEGDRIGSGALFSAAVSEPDTERSRSKNLPSVSTAELHTRGPEKRDEAADTRRARQGTRPEPAAETAARVLDDNRPTGQAPAKRPPPGARFSAEGRPRHQDGRPEKAARARLLWGEGAEGGCAPHACRPPATGQLRPAPWPQATVSERGHAPEGEAPRRWDPENTRVRGSEPSGRQSS